MDRSITAGTEIAADTRFFIVFRAPGKMSKGKVSSLFFLFLRFYLQVFTFQTDVFIQCDYYLNADVAMALKVFRTCKTCKTFDLTHNFEMGKKKGEEEKTREILP